MSDADDVRAAAQGCLFFLIAPIAPFLIIWALNTLFHLGIELTFWTYLAALVLVLFL
jgi:hypothetical protein